MAKKANKRAKRLATPKVTFVLNDQNSLVIDNPLNATEYIRRLINCFPLLKEVDGVTPSARIVESHIPSIRTGKTMQRSSAYTYLQRLQSMGLITITPDERGRDVPVKIKDWLLIKL
jgi:hypothetical protein